MKLMQEHSTKKIYDLQSVFYDATFGRLVKRRIERAINHMNISDTDVVLDLGIGTGAQPQLLSQPRPDHRHRSVQRHAARVPQAASASAGWNTPPFSRPMRCSCRLRITRLIMCSSAM